MRFRSGYPSAILAAMILCFTTCYAAEVNQNGTSGVPAASAKFSHTETVTPSRIIPVGSPAASSPRLVSGKVTIGALVPQNVRPASIVFYVDGKQLGSTKNRPFRFDNWDTASLPDGEHTVKVEALSAEGTVAWSGETKIIVKNKDAGPAGTPRVPKPVAKPSSAGPAQAKVEAPVKPPKMEIFKSPRYGFSVSYPAGWNVADFTRKMKPKWDGGFWFVFSPNAADKGITMNLRHKKETAAVTADSFSKQPDNSYVNIWQRTEINGKEAFRTTQGSPQAKRLIHRCIILDGQSIWMLNCIDTTGSTSDKSRMYFDALVNSLQTSVPVKAEKPSAGKRPAPKPMPKEKAPDLQEEINLEPGAE